MWGSAFLSGLCRHVGLRRTGGRCHTSSEHLNYTLFDSGFQYVFCIIYRNYAVQIVIQYNLFDAVRDGLGRPGPPKGKQDKRPARGPGGPALVRARLPAKPLISVSGREPRARNFGYAGPAAGMVRARLPAKPLISVPCANLGPEISDMPALRPAWFALDSPLALVAPFRGAKSSHNFRAHAWGRPTFPGRGLLPAAR